MKKTTKILLLFGLIAILTAAIVISASAVSGAAFTTYNPWVDGAFKDVCKNSIINCNIYGSKPDVWLNGGPAANGLGPDGDYFFAVLVPGGQPDPNDGGFKNLSDDHDAYTNRIFTVTDGEVSAYSGSHDLDSGDTSYPRDFCTSKRGCLPDGLPPLIRLFPYADTTNPGGVYILAICSLADGYPVDPRDCKYDAFKVKEGPMRYSFMIEGMKFKDLDANGVNDNGDFGLQGWEITIDGTGFEGEPINTSVFTDEDGYWSFGKDYSFNPNDTPVAAKLTICEVFPDGEVWYQSLPGGDECYEIVLEPAAMAYWNQYPLDFGNFQEELTVTKTVDTSFTRKHFWDIAKSVDTVYGFMENELPKIWLYVDGRWDETATWTVDVTYLGSSDYDFNVSGDITIKNTGTVTAVITSVVDELAGTAIDVDCGESFETPFALAGGETLTCTYNEDGYVEGSNVATVTTQRDTYSGSADIIWGDPTTEINKTVHIKDISDLFGDVALGSVTAPNGDSFSYSKAFSWDDYGAGSCGDYVYDNIATIVETGQSASATLLVNVQCYDYESAWAEGSGANVDVYPFCSNGFNNWGWSNLIGPGTTYEGWTLWAGAGQCDTSKGLDAGWVDVVYDGGYVTVTYHLNSPYYILKETHVYAGSTMFPQLNGDDTTAPGQYTNIGPFSGEIYVIAHAVVGIPDPDFGP